MTAYNKESAEALRPEDFPISSVESRAAARAMLQNKPLTAAERDSVLVEILDRGRARVAAGEPYKIETEEEMRERGRRLRELLRRQRASS
jgi:hypothetical protein